MDIETVLRRKCLQAVQDPASPLTAQPHIPMLVQEMYDRPMLSTEPLGTNATLPCTMSEPGER